MTSQLCLFKTPTFVKFLDVVKFMDQSGPGLSSRPIDVELNSWQISKVECEIFNVSLHLNNALYFAFARYENMLGIVQHEPYTDEDAEQDRRVYKGLIPPQWTLDRPVFCYGMAAYFMMVSCRLPFDQCMGYAKMRDAAMHRSGLINYSEISPDSFWKS